MSSRATRPRRHDVAVCLFAAAVLGACAVSTNDEPQAAGNLFNDLVQSSTTSTSTTTPDDARKTEPLYFLETTEGATRLKFVERRFEMDAGISDILANLVTTPPDTDGDESPEERGLTSAIPEGAVLVSATMASPDSTELVLDITGLFGSLDGSPLRNALAQLVWTATEPSNVRSVSFRSNGERKSAIVGNGENVDRAVDRRDYTSLG